MNVDNTIGNRLLYLLEKRGISAYILAKDTGIAESTISRIINKGSRPNRSNSKVLSNYFGVSRDWLLTGEKVEAIEDELTDKSHSSLTELIESLRTESNSADIDILLDEIKTLIRYKKQYMIAREKLMEFIGSV